MKEVVISLLIVSAIAAVAFLGGAGVGSRLLPACPDCAECYEVREYYRGVYDLCLAFEDTTASFCLWSVGQAYRNGRHERLSPGFDWPPLEPVSPDDG